MKHKETNTTKEMSTEKIQMEGNGKKRFRWWYAVVFTGAVLLLIYLGVVVYYSNHFYKGTSINNVSCSNMTLEKAEAAIKSQAKAYVLTLEERNDITEQIKGSDFDLDYVLEGDIQEVMSGQNAFLWPFLLFKEFKEKLPSSIQYNGEKFESVIDQLICMQEENKKQPKNARISSYSKKERSYRMIPEDKGTVILRDMLIVKCKEAIQELNPIINLEEEDCYKKVAITSEDKELNKALETMNRYVSTEIKYQFDDKEEILDGNIIYQFIKKSKKNKVTLQEDKIEEFVRDLAKTYDTFGKTRKFKTSYKKTITITGGDYGWWMDKPKETQELKKLIKKGAKKERTPEYRQKAVDYSKKDYGNTYVEINLKRQHLYYYKNGKKILESDIVSGNPYKGNATPTGLYGVIYKQTPATLRGEDYSTPVEFWMPFYGNVGMHDATWRSKFGGNIYQGNGSHGCINMPYEKAKELFRHIKPKTPVFCYNL